MQTLAHFANGLSLEWDEAAFKRTLPGTIVVLLNVLMALMSANFFLGMLRVSAGDWLMMNTCVPSIALFVIGFLLGSPVLMVAGAVMMFRYGTLGLLVFSWSGGNLIAQAGHVLMTLAVITIALEVVRGRRWKSLGLGLLLGLLVLFPLETVQTMWIVDHPDTAVKLFSGSLTLPGQ